MTDRQETIADIIAWLRRPREGENAYLTVWRDEIADRLEAAWKRDTLEFRRDIEYLKEERNKAPVRERERLRKNGFVIVPQERLSTKPAENVISVAASDTAGNGAKLREALEAIINGYKNADLCDMNYGEWCHDPANVCVNVPLCKAIHEARAALAAPPRNCDRFATLPDALAAWRDADPREAGPFDLWLFAPATEQEGGAK